MSYISLFYLFASPTNNHAFVCSDNEARLAHLEEAKKSYLFSSEQLLEILGMTPSIKTKISMIGQIGPRLMDPKAKHDVLVDMFVYAEQKKEVEDILKARAQHLLASAGAQPGGGGGIMLGGRGGRGRGAPTPIGSSMTGRGRGGPGRGPMISRPPTNPKQESSGTSDEAPLPIPPTASIYPLSQSVPKRRPSSAQLALEGAGFEANVIESGVGQLKLLNDRSSPAVASIDGASPGPIQDPVDFDEDLKNKSEERLRVTAVRRSSKIDDWMQNMKSKGSNDIMESSSPSELPQEDNEEGDDVFEDPVVPPPARRATKRLSVLPLALDSKYLLLTF